MTSYPNGLPPDDKTAIREQFRDTDPPYYVGDDLHEAKVEQAHEVMAAHDLDAMLLFRDEAVRYLTDFYPKGYGPWSEIGYCCVLTPDAEPVLGYASGTDLYRAGLFEIVPDVRRLPSHDDWDRAIAEIFADYGVEGRVGTDRLPFWLASDLADRCPDVSFDTISDAWHDLTAVKLPEEIAIIEEASAIAEVGMETAIDHAQPGATEREVAIEAEYAMRTAGSEVEPFIFDLCAGRNAGVFNRIPTDRRIRNGDLVAMDMGAVYRGYNGEFARSVSVGAPTEAQREVYRTVYESLQAGLAAIEPGVPCGDVDRAVREVIRDAGYKRYEHDRDTGHQTAYGLHGNPAIGPDVEAPLEPGMVVNIEPRIAMFDRPQVGGVQLEEIVLVTDDGTELLTTTPFDEALLAG